MEVCRCCIRGVTDPNRAAVVVLKQRGYIRMNEEDVAYGEMLKSGPANSLLLLFGNDLESELVSFPYNLND